MSDSPVPPDTASSSPLGAPGNSPPQSPSPSDGTSDHSDSSLQNQSESPSNNNAPHSPPKSDESNDDSNQSSRKESRPAPGEAEPPPPNPRKRVPRPPTGEPPPESQERAALVRADSDGANPALPALSQSGDGSGGPAATIQVTFDVRFGPLRRSHRNETRPFPRGATIATAREALGSIAELSGYRLLFERNGQELADNGELSDGIQVRPVVRVRLGPRLYNFEIFSGTDRSTVGSILEYVKGKHPVGSADVRLRKAGESSDLPPGTSIRGLAAAANECLELVGAEFTV
jgi:hypothetical protein